MRKMAYSIRGAAETSDSSRTKIYEAINAGTLKAKKRGKRTIILADDLIAYLEALPDFPNQAVA